ncbi:hypothetical protein [Streptomyces sp. NPDC097610]|uniref:hypothetical protein n=1 Tax=Streptomyces sp. NPDC097610 TaxID=3157227 RepID=UPI00332A32AA
MRAADLFGTMDHLNVTNTGSGSGDLDRIVELAPEASANVRHQHVISQLATRQKAPSGCTTYRLQTNVERPGRFLPPRSSNDHSD